MGQKGNIFLYITFSAVILVAIGLGWFYLKDQAAFGGLNLPLPFLNQTEKFDTQGWKSLKDGNKSLTILYPPDWFVTENRQSSISSSYISEYPFTPGKASSDINNVVYLTPILGQLQSSYANEDWFNLLYNAKVNTAVTNEFRASDQNRFTKVKSAKTLNGDRYVLFEDSKYPTQLQAYLIITNLEVYQFTLDHHNQNGIDLFKKIISTSTK